MPPQPANLAQTRWILFGSFLMSLVIQTGMAFFLRSQPDRPAPMPEETLTTMTLVLGIAAVSLSGLVQMAPRLFGKGNYQTLFILRMAFSEAVGLFGFLLFFLGASETILLGFMGWAALLILSSAPTESSERELTRQQLEKR
jgi:hypothetical protein